MLQLNIMEKKKEFNLLDDAISIGAINKKYPFSKVIKSTMRKQVSQKLSPNEYMQLLLVESECVNQHDNSVNFDILEEFWYSSAYIRQIRAKLKKAHLVKKLKIKEKTAWYLNPLLSHSWRTQSVLYLFYEFKDETFAEYY